MNLRVDWATAEDATMRGIPSKWAYATIVLIIQGLNSLELIGVPKMQLLAWGADR
jgi:hypothetical protein